MGVITRLLQPRAETSDEAIARMLRRAVFGGGAATKSGQWVSADSALQCAAVFSCVRVISEDVASLPLHLYRRKPGGGRERATDHRLYRVLHLKPNSWQTSVTWRQMTQAHIELRGNAYGYIVRVGNEVREILPIHPDKVSVTQGADYALSYRVSGREEPFRQDEILHLRGLTLDGLVGLTPIQVHREAIGLALATQEHGARLFSNGAQPGVALTHPKTLSKPVAERLKETFDARYQGGENAHKTVVLEEGMSLERLGMTSEDAQFLETRKYQRSEIAALWRIPPHMIGDLERATFSNIEQQSLDYVKVALLGRLVAWEQQLNASLLSPAEQEIYYFEFLLDGLLRGDSASRAAMYHDAILDGWMSRNEVREKENLNPAEGLDTYLEPSNMDRADQAKRRASATSNGGRS